jgi:hypothetical protein
VEINQHVALGVETAGEDVVGVAFQHPQTLAALRAPQSQSGVVGGGGQVPPAARPCQAVQSLDLNVR